MRTRIYRIKPASKFVIKKLVLSFCIANGPVHEVVVFGSHYSWEYEHEHSDRPEEDFREDLAAKTFRQARRNRHAFAP